MFRPLYSGFPGHVHNAAEPRTNLRLHGDLSLRVFNKCRPLTTQPLRLSQLKRRKKKHRRGASQLPCHSPSFLRSTASHQLRFENFPTNSPLLLPSDDTTARDVPERWRPLSVSQGEEDRNRHPKAAKSRGGKDNAGS